MARTIVYWHIRWICLSFILGIVLSTIFAAWIGLHCGSGILKYPRSWHRTASSTDSSYAKALDASYSTDHIENHILILYELKPRVGATYVWSRAHVGNDIPAGFKLYAIEARGVELRTFTHSWEQAVPIATDWLKSNSPLVNFGSTTNTIEIYDRAFGIPFRSVASTEVQDKVSGKTRWDNGIQLRSTWIGNLLKPRAAMPTHVLWTGTTLNAIAWGSPIYLLAVLVRFASIKLRESRVQCKSCGYSLTDLISPTCPECGRTIAAPPAQQSTTLDP